MKKNFLTLNSVLVAAHLQAQSVGSYVQVNSQNPIIVLGYAKVLTTNATQITVQDKEDTYTFNRNTVTISKGNKPTSQFVAYTPTTKTPTPEPSQVSATPTNLTHARTPRTLQVNGYWALQDGKSNWVNGPYVPSGRVYPANFVPNMVIQANPNYNSKNLQVGEIVNVKFGPLSFPNARVVSASATKLVIQEPVAATQDAFDQLGALNVTPVTPQASPSPKAKTQGNIAKH